MSFRLYSAILFCFCWAAVSMHADEYVCPAHENVLTVEYGGIWQNDEYLSPLLYGGQMIGLQHEWWSALRDWRHVGKIHITGAMTDNDRAIRNSQYAVGVNGGWGALYDFNHIMQVRGFNVFVGPYLHADYMLRSISSYQNKPYSMDISATVCLHAGVSYTIHCPRSAYRLQYTLMTDLVGAMFAPDYWQSYHEMNTSLQGVCVFASLHNRQRLQHELSVDMEFRKSTWRIGVRHEYLQSMANNLHFSRESVSVVVGTVFNHRVSKTSL